MSQTVTSAVTLSWRPPRYAARWADTPDEVPPFDPSRGGDPFAPQARFEVGETTIVVHSDATLGGTAPSPSPEWRHEFQLDESGAIGWEDYPNYPRLVRVDRGDVGEKAGGQKPLEAIAALTLVPTIEELMEKARQTMERFGPLAYGEFDFTLRAWSHAAQAFQVHLGLLKHLTDAKEAEGVPLAQIELDDAHRRRVGDAVTGLSSTLHWDTVVALQDIMKRIANLEDLRVGLAGLYWQEFNRNTLQGAHPGALFNAPSRPYWGQPHLTALGDAPGQIIVRCGCRGWAFYELWQRASNGGIIRQCEGCGRLFQPRRKDARHCRDNCRVTSHRRRA